MSIATQITRIQTDRNTIRAKLVELGMANATDNLDVLAEAVDGITNAGAISATVKEGETYTIPAGYHNGSGTVSGVAGGGSYNLQSKTITPTKNQQTATPDDGYYGLSDVIVKSIPDAYQDVSSVTAGAADVLTGKVIVTTDGTVTTGSMPNIGSASKTLDATEGNQSFAIAKGYHDGTGAVSVVLEEKTATPSKAAQTIEPTTGKVISKVTVGAIPEEYQDVTGVTAGAADILTGKKGISTDGTLFDGTMANNGAINATIDGLTVTSYAVPAGYTSGGTVSLTSDIEDALAAI